MNTYFSRVRLNPTRRGTRRLLASPQALHATVLGSHPDGIAGESSRVLWRVDRGAPHDIDLYVVSPSSPDFTGLLEQAGWPSNTTWETTDYERFLGRLVMGQQWRFRVTANPVQAVKNREVGAPSRGRVKPHISTTHQEGWFRARSGTWGFEVLDLPDDASTLRVENRSVSEFRRWSDGDERSRVSITRADFTGVLQVVDADKLRQHLCTGMGRAKAYGCGLMTLAPLR